jgi:hypothetical protein
VNEPFHRDVADCGAILRVFHFLTAYADPAVRVKRLYFLMREELCDKIDTSWDKKYFQQSTSRSEAKDDPNVVVGNEETVDPNITELHKVLSQRPFSTRAVEDSYPEEASEVWRTYDGVMSFAEKLNFVGSFIQFAFPFLFVPTLSAHWLMLTLFVGKCVSIVVILLLAPAALSYRRLW